MDKRAVTISKRRTGTNWLILVGHFATGEAGARYLGIETHASSAVAVLRSEGYLVELFTGDKQLLTDS